jgi:hypothetical protein
MTDQNDYSLHPNEDFITQVANHISKHTGTSPRWSEDIATSLLSTVMGPDRYISNQKGRLPLNLMYMTIGPSGLATKTLPLKTYFVPILIKMTDLANYPFLLPSKWTPEALTGYLKEHSVGCMYRDEFTSMFKEAYQKDYMSDSLEFISELYDGTIQKRITIAHGLGEYEKVYVTMISATTPYVYKVFRVDFYIQGTGNRILLEIFYEEDIPNDRLDPESFFGKGPELENLRIQFINNVAESLFKIRESNVQYLFPDDDSAELWCQYEHECKSQALQKYKTDHFDLHYSYQDRLPEMALKLSGLYTISRLWDKIILDDAPRELIILERDMRRAIDKANYHFEQFERMLQEWRTVPAPTKIYTHDAQAQFILGALHNNQRGLSWTELRRLAKWDTSDWREVLKYLHQAEKITIVLAENEGAGRRPIMFLEIAPNMALPKGKVFTDWRQIEDWLSLK